MSTIPEHESRMANGNLTAKKGSIGHPLYALLSRVSIRHGRQEIVRLRVQLGGEISSVSYRLSLATLSTICWRFLSKGRILL